MRKYVRVCLYLDKELWDNLCLTYGNRFYDWVSKGEVHVQEPISMNQVRCLHGGCLYGHHGLWLDPEDLFRERIICLRSEHIVVNVLERKVFVRGKRIWLHPADYELLVLFMRHSGNVLTRNTIINFLESRHCRSIQDNAVSVHVRRIRKVLKDPSCIQTIPLEGYRWNLNVIAEKGLE